jgi:predicted ATPase/class 3 adenylate cyclase
MESRSHLAKTPGPLPIGTVTFLFTDIEGSTALLKQLGDRYSDLLSAHRGALRAAFEAHGGSEVDTQGDAFFYSFPRASDAVAGAVEGQRRLAGYAWPAGVEVRVRMGLHTGEPLLEGEGYVGMDVHRAARIAHAGHGGQVLLSETVTSLVRDDLPPGIALLDLGQHMLKDMLRPERIHQLSIEGLDSAFPPLRSEAPARTNLPAHIPDLVGRDEELEEVKSLVHQKRLVTLTGSGGVGKTTLALRAARDLVDDFPEGVWMIELAPIQSPEYLISAITDAIDFQVDVHSSDLDPKRQVLDYLNHRRTLLLMDNFEHLLGGAGTISDILQETEDVRLMITTRERLNLRGEWPFVLGGLGYPRNGNGRSPDEYSAFRLFWARAEQVDPGFERSAENIRHALKICRLVEGMPLAIELAAAWLPVLSIHEIAQEIESDLDFLSSEQADLPAEHRSLRAVFDRSWAMMSEAERGGLRGLSVIHGSFDREAAKRVAEVSLPVLSGLIRKSLLRRRPEGRYDMHELLRAYAAEKLSQTPDEEEAVRERQARHYTRDLAQLAPFLHTVEGRDHRAVTRADMPNIRQAVIWGVRHWELGEVQDVLYYLAGLYHSLGWHEGRDFYAELLASLRPEGSMDLPSERQEAIYLSAAANFVSLASPLGDDSVQALYDEMIPKLRERGQVRELGLTLLAQGISKEYSGDSQGAAELQEEALPIFTDLNQPFLTASCYLWLGWALYGLGKYDRAGALFQESLRLSRGWGNVVGTAYSLGKMGTWADARESYAEAMGYHQEALELFDSFGDTAGRGYCLSRLSLSTWGMGDYAASYDYGRRGLQAFESIGHRWGICTSLCRAGFGALEMGAVDEAFRLFTGGMESALDYEYSSTVIYALIGIGACLGRSGDPGSGGELLDFSIHQESAPALYRDIARKYAAQLEAEDVPAAEEVGALTFEDAVALARRKAREKGLQ